MKLQSKVIFSWRNTFFEHWFQGQYSWSIITGLLTLTITIFSKCKWDAIEITEVPSHVLILTPLFVLFNVQFLTIRPRTGSSLGYFPKLPTLIPCPGPHVMFRMTICRLPSPREMQSSPVPIFELIIFTLVDLPIWISSVLGLFSGALTLKFVNVILLHPKTLAWKYLLSFEFMSWIIELLRKAKPKFCEKLHQIQTNFNIRNYDDAYFWNEYFSYHGKPYAIGISWAIILLPSHLTLTVKCSFTR